MVSHAAERNNPAAISTLRSFYAKGLGPLKRDKIQACMWYLIGKERNADVVQEIKDCSRVLRLDEMVEGQRRSREWLQAHPYLRLGMLDGFSSSFGLALGSPQMPNTGSATGPRTGG